MFGLERKSLEEEEVLESTLTIGETVEELLSDISLEEFKFKIFVEDSSSEILRDFWSCTSSCLRS